LQQAREHKSQIVQAPVEKNETDTELAIQTALQHGATNITLLGGLGGARFDHTIANVQLLVGFADIPIRIIDGPAVCWLLRGPGQSSIHGHVDDIVSLLPLTAEAANVKTQGLYYPLHGETLHFGKPRGVSNHLTQPLASVSLTAGLLLLIHTNIQELYED
ncbi:MAG: thiamine diphosphokinase, partial [Ktedonobacteraceae bacterium]